MSRSRTYVRSTWSSRRSTRRCCKSRRRSRTRWRRRWRSPEATSRNVRTSRNRSSNFKNRASKKSKSSRRTWPSLKELWNVTLNVVTITNSNSNNNVNKPARISNKSVIKRHKKNLTTLTFYKSTNIPKKTIKKPSLRFWKKTSILRPHSCTEPMEVNWTNKSYKLLSRNTSKTKIITSHSSTMRTTYVRRSRRRRKSSSN